MALNNMDFSWKPASHLGKLQRERGKRTESPSRFQGRTSSKKYLHQYQQFAIGLKGRMYLLIAFLHSVLHFKVDWWSRCRSTDKMKNYCT